MRPARGWKEGRAEIRASGIDLEVIPVDADFYDKLEDYLQPDKCFVSGDGEAIVLWVPGRKLQFRVKEGA